jgi:hypothetical protein
MAKPMVRLHPNILALALLTIGATDNASATPAAGSSQPIERQAVEWQPVEGSADPGQLGPVWELVPPGEGLFSGENPDELNPAFEPPTSLEEVEALLSRLWPIAEDYLPLLRLGQLPTATLPPEGGDQISFQQVSPGDGGAAGGTGNQNYGFRADLVLNRHLLLSGFYTNADDPFFKRITVRPSQPANLWEVGGGSLRARLASFGSWTLAGEGSLELFTVGSGCGGAVSCDGPGTPNIFNNSGEKVFTRNWVGSVALPLSWQATPQLQLSFVPAVSFLPGSQGAGQGGSGTFYGTTVNLGFGANYRLGNQLQLFGSAMVPLGPGTNAFDGELNFSRVPILSAGAHIAVNPRIGLEASVTNGFGLTPATAILALPSAPREPMASARFVWTPIAVDSPSPDYTTRQASLALGGLSVNTALTPRDGTTQLWVNGDTRGNIFGGGGYSVSNDFQFQLAAGMFNGIQPRNSFVDTFAGDGGLNLRFGGKAMVFRPTKALPIWAAGRLSVGRNEDESSKQGYLFFETMNTWEATPRLAFSLNPKLAWSGRGTSWGVGVGANLQLSERFQLIPELNAVATDLGGRNGTNGSLALRWLASPFTTVDLYVSNAAGLFDLGQLLGNDQVRVGARLLISF